MHIPEIRLLCVAYADNLQFDESDVSHLLECSDCYERWRLFLQDVEGWQAPTTLDRIGEVRFKVEHIEISRMWQFAHSHLELAPKEQAHLVSCDK